MGIKLEFLGSGLALPCITHESHEAAAPLWAHYERLTRKLSVVFDNGHAQTLATPISDRVAQHLTHAHNIMVVRLHRGSPINSLECHLRQI